MTLENDATIGDVRPASPTIKGVQRADLYVSAKAEVEPALTQRFRAVAGGKKHGPAANL